MTQHYRAILVFPITGEDISFLDMIGRLCPHLHICASVHTGAEALFAIREYRPEIVFIESDHPEEGILHLLEGIPDRDFDLFSVKKREIPGLHLTGTETSSKPPKRVVLQRENDGPAESHPLAPFRSDDEPLKAVPPHLQHGTLLLPTVQGIILVATEEINYVFSDNKYATLALHTGEKIFVSYSLKELIEILPMAEFVRPHQSWIVRIAAIRKIQKGEGLFLCLKDKTTVPVSRRNKDEVFRVLGL